MTEIAELYHLIQALQVGLNIDKAKAGRTGDESQFAAREVEIAALIARRLHLIEESVSLFNQTL